MRVFDTMTDLAYRGLGSTYRWFGPWGVVGAIGATLIIGSSVITTFGIAAAVAVMSSIMLKEKAPKLADWLITPVGIAVTAGLMLLVLAPVTGGSTVVSGIALLALAYGTSVGVPAAVRFLKELMHELKGLFTSPSDENVGNERVVTAEPVYRPSSKSITLINTLQHYMFPHP